MPSGWGADACTTPFALTVLTDKLVGHVFRLEKGLVQRFDIRST